MAFGGLAWQDEFDSARGSSSGSGIFSACVVAFRDFALGDGFGSAHGSSSGGVIGVFSVCFVAFEDLVLGDGLFSSPHIGVSSGYTLRSLEGPDLLEALEPGRTSVRSECLPRYVPRDGPEARSMAG